MHGPLQARALDFAGYDAALSHADGQVGEESDRPNFSLFSLRGGILTPC